MVEQNLKRVFFSYMMCISILFIAEQIEGTEHSSHLKLLSLLLGWRAGGKGVPFSHPG